MQSWMIGLVSGIISVGFWPTLPPWPLYIVFATVASGPVFKRTPVCAFLAGLGLGCLIGCAHGMQLLNSRIAEDCVGIPLTVSGTVSSLPRNSLIRGAVPRQRFEFTVDTLRPIRCAGPRRLQLSYYGDREIHPGDAWQFEVRLKSVWGMGNRGVYNIQAWYARSGIDAVGSVRESGRPPSLLSRANGLFALPDRMRQGISARISELGLQADVAAVLQAISVADASGINAPLWSLFQYFGINHLLVISGLHVGMVAAVGYILGGVLLRLLSPVSVGGRWLPPAFALCLAALYGALAGMSLPVQRALCMLACFVVAGIAGRKTVAGNNLLLAAVCVLLLNPLAAVGSGFWLSFGAVAALLWFGLWQRGIPRLRLAVQTQAAISLFMLPLGALFFGGGSLIAVVANLVMIPLLGWVVVPLTLLAALCFLCNWEIASPLWYLAAWPLDSLLPLGAHLAEHGGNWLYVPLNAEIELALLGVLAVALCVLPGRRTLKTLSAMMALPMLLPLQPSSDDAKPDTTVSVLDVGQGTAVVVRSGNMALLYDTGGGDPDGVNMATLTVLPYLQREGITALDTLVISHPDLDHSAGTAVIMEALPVERFRYGGVEREENSSEAVGRACIAGEAWRWPGGQTFQFLSPARELPRRRNNSSCVLQIQVGEHRLLLPGDIESEREKMLVRYWGSSLESDWLAAAHHGSKTSTSMPFLKTVKPQVVVISAGYANRFGHPHPDVIARLSWPEVNVLSTAVSGGLEFTLAPGVDLKIWAYREAVRRYWM